MSETSGNELSNKRNMAMDGSHGRDNKAESANEDGEVSGDSFPKRRPCSSAGSGSMGRSAWGKTAHDGKEDGFPGNVGPMVDQNKPRARPPCSEPIRPQACLGWLRT